MIIKNEKPPKIWERAHREFEIDDSETLYTYGDTIYNPAGLDLRQEFIEHESVHARQQAEIGGPDVWWGKYFTDPIFRITQEAEAYGRQHAYICTVMKDRNKRAKHLWILASYLASPLYKANMSHSDATRAIRDQAMKK
jgi:hypothetical protein